MAMNARFAARRRLDRGSVLPLTLVLTVVFALVAVAIASYTTTALGTTRVTERKVDRLAAAESGMQEALVQLAASGTCPTVLDDRNGASVSVESCELREVSLSTSDVPFSLILTALGLDPGTDAFVRSASHVNTIEVGGEVFVALTATGSAQNVQATGHVISQATECPTSGRLTGPGWLGLADSDCTENDWTHHTTIPQIPAIASAGIGEPSGCTVVHSGTHTNLTVKGDVYFESGVHRIRGPLRMRNDPPKPGRITAGHNGTVTLPADHACHQAQTEDVDAGAAVGAVFVFEHDGYVSVEGNGTRAELYGLRTGGRSLSAVAYTTAHPDPGGVYAASTRNPESQPLVHVPNGNPNAAFSFFGEIWTPRGFVDIESQMSSSGAAGAAFQGGAVIARFAASTSNDVSGIIFGSGEAPVEVHHRVRVTATSPDGITTTVSVVARHRPDGEFRVQSWRVV